ncbi:Phospholipid-transporting ATPase [Entamoeba marina]
MFKNPRSSVYSFIGWFLFGIYQSLVFFFIMYWCIIPNDVSSLSGKSGGMVFTSVTVTMYSLFGIIITLIIETRTWDIISISGHVISIILIFVIYGLTCYIPGFSTMDMSWFGLSQTFSQPNFYLASILAIVITNLPILLKKYLERRFSPQFWHIAQEIERSLHSNYGKKRIIHTEGSPELYQYIRSTLPILPKITHSQQLITNADPSSASSDDKRVSIDTDLSSVHVLPRSDD